MLSGTDNSRCRGYAVYCGVDVGKSEHHACALDPSGHRLYDRRCPTTRPPWSRCWPGWPNTARSWSWSTSRPRSVPWRSRSARSLGIDVGYLPGLAMRRIADLYPGEGKTDARDAYVIADAARTMPHTLRRVGTDDETLAELTVLAGYDDDLAAQSTRLANRLHDALLHIHPALERLLGKHFDRAGRARPARRRTRPRPPCATSAPKA